MKCPHCQKEINESGFVYCPHCGKQLEPTKKKGISLRKGGLLAFVVWAGLTAVCYGLDKLDPAMRHVGWGLTSRYEPVPGNPVEWAPVLAFVFALAILYAFGAWAIYTVAKRHGRNTVRWTTAAIVFSPVLAWAVYGLTWRKSQ